MSRFKIKSQSPLKKKSRRGFRGYPVATVAFYGPDDTRASKVAVGIVASEGAHADPLERWFSEDGDARKDPAIGRQILEFTQQHGVKTVVVTDGIIGCPHEEGIDYPDGEVCPACPFWAHRDRWTGRRFSRGSALGIVEYRTGPIGNRPAGWQAAPRIMRAMVRGAKALEMRLNLFRRQS